MFKISSLLCALLLLNAFAAEPKLSPRHDPPDQLFRRAPMAQSTRSVVVNLATNLHYAFDTDLARVHTIWRGDSLNLWGPPYSYAKAPFICDFNGDVLFSFPQLSPWSPPQESLPTRFRGIETEDGEITFSYEILTGSERVQIFESLQGTVEGDAWSVVRTFHSLKGTTSELAYLAFAESGASIKQQGSEVQIVGTNGTMLLTATISGKPLSCSIATEQVDYQNLFITEEGSEKGFKPTRSTGSETRARLLIPPQKEPFTIELTLRHGTPSSAPAPAKRAVESRTYSGTGELRAPSGDDSYKVEYFPLPPEAEMMITGMDWLPNGNLAVCTWLGEIYIVENAIGDVRKATYHRFARGLNEPLGLAVHEGVIYVVQKGELTRVEDTNHDGVADLFSCVNSSWGYSGNYHSYSFGPLITPQGDFFVFITGQRGLYELPFQGWALKISATGDEVTPFCSGLRVPHGWGFYGPARDIFTTDNQGNWIGACRLNHLQQGHFYGFPSSTPAPKTIHSAQDVEPPVLWFPRSLAPSASGFDTIPDHRFGPFEGQMLIGDFQNSIVMRAFLEKINGRWQGVVFPFAKGFLSGVNRLKIGPDARLYVGGGKRTWSTAAPREFSLDRVVFTGKEPFEVKEVHATSDGFELTFTKALEKKTGSEAANYLLKQFTYQYHEAYGSPEYDHFGKVGATETPVQKVEWLDNGRRVRLGVPGLRIGFVTSFQLAVNSEEDEDLRNDTFYYTLNSQPNARSAQ